MSNPKIEVLPIDKGATPDLQNVNKHTQRGRGLHENSMRKRGAGRSIFSAGLFLFVYFFMACFANSQSVINVKSVFWIFSPFFYMMGAKNSAFCIALLTSIVIALENIGAPFFILISTHCSFSCAGVSFISRVRFSLLKMFRTSPMFGGGAFFYPFKKLYSKLWFTVKRGLLFSNLRISYGRTPSAFLRAIIMVLCWGCSKFFFTIQTDFYKWRIETISRTIYPLSFLCYFRSDIKYFFASRTYSFDMLNKFRHFLSKKVLPSRRAVLYLRQNQFSLSGSV